MNKAKKVVIILYHYSVVARGFERKLRELGYEVDVLEDFSKIEYSAAETDLFLLYLPGDIMDDLVKHKTLEEICQTVRSIRSKMIILGEMKYHQELVASLPLIEEFRWLNRPVDSDVLGTEVEKAISQNTDTVSGKTVLIIDDDPVYARLVREWIKDFFHAEIATKGMQAITYLLKNHVDLILLDYEMPIVNGSQLLQLLRQDPSTAGIPVVFLTGVSTKDEVAKVMELKPEGYLLKTTSREALLDYLSKKLSR